MKATENARLLERLAAAEHDSWARWMRWVFRVSRPNRDGTVTIPADLARRWLRQMETPYARLSEEEKEQDREEVRRILPIIEGEAGE